MPPYPTKPKSKQNIPDASDKSHGANKVPDASPSKIDTQNQTQKPYYGWNLRRTTPYQRLNAVIMALILFVTTTYAYFSYLQWQVLREQTQSANRAYVFFNGMDINKLCDSKTNKVYEWQFIVKWENSGNTPARNARTQVYTATRPTPFPKGFKFPQPSDPSPKYFRFNRLTEPSSPKDIAAHTIDKASILRIPIDRIIAAKNHSVYLYVLGWVTYRDILKGTPEHTTRFCLKVDEIGTDPTNPDIIDANIVFSVHPEYNYSN